MPVPHRLATRRPQGRLPAATALVHPTTGEELGRYFACDDGYTVVMPDAAGDPRVTLPRAYPTVHAAKEAILAAHEPEGDDP